MNLPSGLKSEFVKPIATIIGPGAIAVAPYVILLAFKFPAIGDAISNSPGMAGSILFVLALMAGMLIEDVGSEFEVRVLDRWQKNEKHAQNWVEYLNLSDDGKCIAFKYIATVVVRLKFEIATGLALIVAVPGFLWMNMVVSFLDMCWAFLWSFVALSVACYCFYESLQSSVLLSETRDRLLTQIRKEKGMQSDQKQADPQQAAKVSREE